MALRKAPHPKSEAKATSSEHGAKSAASHEGSPDARKVKKKGASRLSKGVKIALVAVGCLAMLLSVSAMACSGVLNQATEAYHLTGGVAATVNGVNITEDTITKQIMSFRTSSGYASDKDWAQYLVDNSLTPEKYREQTINTYAEQYLMSQAMRENNITVSTDEIDKAWEDAAASYGSESDFEKYLSYFGYTKDSYRESLSNSLAQEKLEKAVAPIKDPTDDDILSYLNENLSTYNDARRSSNLLFKVDSDASDEDKAKIKEKAQGVLDKINAGELSFEDAVKEYSDDTGSKDKGGDVGWDKLTTFVSQYQDALSQLSKGQMSGLVETTYGYHIILCTDVFKVDGSATSIDQVPEDIRKSISDTVKSQKQSSAYQEWKTKYIDDADIKINKMPDDVPYNVSLKGVKPTSTGSGSATTANAAGSASAS